jgi:hypothetical protein
MNRRYISSVLMLLHRCCGTVLLLLLKDVYTINKRQKLGGLQLEFPATM